jgi:hypothetical protein
MSPYQSPILREAAPHLAPLFRKTVQFLACFLKNITQKLKY